MDNQILVLRSWEARMENNPTAFNMVSLWIQVWNLSIHWLCKAVGYKLGEVFNSVKEVIILVGEGKKGRHMKIFAELDVSKPLARGTKVKLNGT